jgi:hypothetical protein
MCWSAKASLSSFIIGWVSCIILIIRNKPMDRYYGLFFMFVLSMQFFEFLIWLDQPEKGSQDCETSQYKGKLNNIVSQVSAIQNLLQPFIGGILVIIFLKNKLILPFSVVLILFCIYFISLVIWIFTSKLYKKTLCTIPSCGNCKSSSIKKNHHLQWQWTQPSFTGKWIWIMYFIYLIIVIVMLSKTWGGLGLGIFLAISAGLSFTIYPLKKAAGSWWCVMATAGPIIKLLIPPAGLCNNVY